MRQLISGLAALALLGLTVHRATGEMTADGQAARYALGLSPFLDHAHKDDVYRRIVGFLLQDMPLNSSLGVYDAYHLRTIMQVEIPRVSAFRSSKTRANQFKEQIRKVREFLAVQHPKPERATVPLDEAVRFPQFLDFVGENLAATGSVAVIVLGSPLYLDAKEPSFSMVDGYFPSDGHLIASREQSVFGLKNRAGALRGLVVHYGYFGDPWVSEVHQQKIARFWALYLKSQGAKLGAFCGDLATVFKAAQTGGGPASEKQETLDLAQTKIEMLRITRDLGAADWITRDVLAHPASAAPAVTVGPMKIGIRWRRNIDLDLYAAPNPRAETLFFEHTRSSEGYYFKDYRSSPEREYEFIEFQSPVDVWQVQAMINFYDGTAPGGPSGEIRIEFGGKIFSGEFSIPAAHGNQGRAGPSQREFWTRIDVPQILKLKPGAQSSILPR